MCAMRDWVWCGYVGVYVGGWDAGGVLVVACAQVAQLCSWSNMTLLLPCPHRCGTGFMRRRRQEAAAAAAAGLWVMPAWTTTWAPGPQGHTAGATGAQWMAAGRAAAA
jgi:hypothetical protein